MKLKPILLLVSVVALSACKPNPAPIDTPVPTPTPASSTNAVPAATATPQKGNTAQVAPSPAAPVPNAQVKPVSAATPEKHAVNNMVYLVKRHTLATDTGLVAFKEGTIAQITKHKGKTLEIYVKGRTIEVPVEDVTAENPVMTGQ